LPIGAYSRFFAAAFASDFTASPERPMARARALPICPDHAKLAQLSRSSKQRLAHRPPRSFACCLISIRFLAFASALTE